MPLSTLTATELDSEWLDAEADLKVSIGSSYYDRAKARFESVDGEVRKREAVKWNEENLSAVSLAGVPTSADENGGDSEQVCLPESHPALTHFELNAADDAIALHQIEKVFGKEW